MKGVKEDEVNDELFTKACVAVLGSLLLCHPTVMNEEVSNMDQ